MRILLIIAILLIPVSALGITWEFETDGDTQSWTRGGGIWSETDGTYEDMSVSDGVLYLDVVGEYAAVGIHSPELNMDAELFDKLRVRVRVSRGPVIGSFAMWWLATTSSLHEERIQGLTYLHPDKTQIWTEDWQEIESSVFAEQEEWRGKIVRFGLSFILFDKSIGEQPVPDRVEIDWISLTGELEELLDEEIELPEDTFTPGELFGEAVKGAGVMSPYSGGSLWGADFDADRDVDWMICGWAGDRGKLFGVLNEGEGMFSRNWEYAFSEDYHLQPFGGADVDRDGDVDVVMSGYREPDGEDSMVWVFLNRGNGTFAEGGTYPVGSYPARGWVGDMDGDGEVDVVVPNLSPYEVGSVPTEGTISVLLNEGEGTFSSSVEYPAGQHPANVRGADVDGDGDADIVVTSRGDMVPLGEDSWNSPPDYVYVWLNDGGGGLYDRQAYQVGNYPEAMWDGDFDGDGDVDLAVVNHRHERTLTVLVNRGDGVFEEGRSYQQVVRSPRGLWGADFDGDGDVDLALSEWRARVVVLLNQGDGTFVPEGEYRTPMQYSSLFGGDFDGDGDVDLAMGSDDPNGFFLLLNRSKGGVTSVSGEEGVTREREQGWMLYPPRPNPFNRYVAVLFDVACSGRVQLEVYDVLGQRIRSLVDEHVDKGRWEAKWDGGDEVGRAVSSGMYIVKMEGEGFAATRPLLLLR